VSNGSKRTAGNASGGIAKRRQSRIPRPQRPFVVAAKPSPATAGASTHVAAKKSASAAAAAPKQRASTAVPSTPKPASALATRAAFVVAAPRAVPALTDGSLLRVARYALVRYLRNPWFAVDAALMLAVFVVCYTSSFDTASFFGSADFLLGLLSVVGAYGLAHGVVPPERSLPLARANGAARTVGGLTLAAVIIRAAYCLVFVGLALAFQRFYRLDLGALLIAWLGLIVACAYLATVIVCLSTPIAPRAPRIVALVLLVLGFASFNATDLLGDVLFVARIPLLPFIAAYRLALAPTDPLAWLGTVLLAPAAIVGLILLAGLWLRHSLALDPAEIAAGAPAEPAAVAR
jgi:hypothetical protein